MGARVTCRQGFAEELRLGSLWFLPEIRRRRHSLVVLSRKNIMEQERILENVGIAQDSLREQFSRAGSS